MKYCYTNQQMRAADAAAIAGGTPAGVLMERAGKALADAVERAMERTGETPLFVCGGGNNGGDGFVAARILRERGREVQVLCLAGAFSAEAALARQAYPGELLRRIPRRRYALLVDCVLGTGISRAPEGEARALIEFINSCGGYVVSADIPSGLGENGVAYSPCVAARETVCMGQLKACLLLEDGADAAGEISVADIGIPAGGGMEVWEADDVRPFFPPKKRNTNKGDYGSAAVESGDPAFPGAAFLAAGACLKSGVGYTKWMAGEAFYPLCVGKLPAAVLCRTEEVPSCNCLALGMGAGAGEALYARICALLHGYRGTLVLDADALNALARCGADVLKQKECAVILTPHLKEFSRLTGCTVEELRPRLAETARGFAEEYGVTLLLKGCRSLITDGARTAVNVTGSPAQARGGSGDVLAGFLAGTVGRGVPPFEACCAAAYLCGKAGELAAAEMGEYAPDASDLIAYLPRAMRQAAECPNRRTARETSTSAAPAIR